MPLRPFPVPLRVGTDICHIPRIKKLIQSPLPTSPPTTESNSSSSTEAFNRINHFLRKFLSLHEQQLFWQRHPRQNLLSATKASTAFQSPHSEFIQPHLDRAVRYLAGRFAAKEAVIKAISSSRRASFLDIQILPRTSITPGLPAGVYAVILDRPAPASSSDLERQQRSGQIDAGANKIEEIDGQIAEVSISHDGEYATATCIAPELSAVGDVGGEAAARGA